MQEYFTRLRRFWVPDKSAFLWLLIALPGLYFFQTTVHEGTHGVVAWIDNGDFPKVAPFPHQTKSGHFLNGVTIPDQSVTVKERVACDPKQAPISHPRLAGWIGWPQAIAMFLVVGFTAIFVFVPITNPLVAFLLRAWYLGACIDFLFNSAKILFGICEPLQDWARVMIRGDHNSTLFWLFTLFLWLVVLSHFYWVYHSQWGKEPLEERSFWDYRGIAIFLGILSLLAIILSVSISDKESIDKLNFVFFAGLLFQVAGLVACIFYVVTSFTRQSQSE